MLEKYMCHKVVEASVIGEIIQIELGENAPIHILDEDGNDIAVVTQEWMIKHDPAAMQGNYLVKYVDGYLSYSPKEAFDKGYTLIKE